MHSLAQQQQKEDGICGLPIIGMTVTKNNVGSYQLITFPINNRLYTIFWIKGKGCLTCRLHEYVIYTIQTRWYIEMVTISMGLNKSTAHLDEWDF